MTSRADAPTRVTQPADRRRGLAMLVLTWLAVGLASLGARDRADLAGQPTGPVGAELAGTIGVQGVSGLLALAAAGVLLVVLGLPRLRLVRGAL